MYPCGSQPAAPRSAVSVAHADSGEDVDDREDPRAVRARAEVSVAHGVRVTTAKYRASIRSDPALAGVRIYLIVKHDGMGERSMKQAQAQKEQFDDYVREAGRRLSESPRESSGRHRAGSKSYSAS